MVAAFFAIESAIDDAAIWAVCLQNLNDSTQKRLGFIAPGRINEIRRVHNAKFQEVVESKSPESAVIHVEPDRVHERLWIQQGLFLAPVNVDLSFMQNLAGTFNQVEDTSDSIIETPWNKITLPEASPSMAEAPTVFKIILPKNIQNDIKRDLKAANINAATLFPGLEGFARSLRFHL